MLRVDIRDLRKGPVKTVGELEPQDPVFQGLGLELDGPVEVRGQLQATGDHEYLWRGDIHGVLRGECRRCLTEVRHPVDVHVDAAMFTSDPESADAADFYPLPERAVAVDVGDVVREEVALAGQAHLLLCRDDCAGLCPRCGADLNAGPCGCRAPAEPV
jgi:uncharacterized protein